ncbi:MAG: hypothetical protein AABW47_03170, partial [Nanoarchaeota archaeon]
SKFRDNTSNVALIMQHSFDLYKKHKIDVKNLMIIDAISHKQGLKTEEVANVFFVENVKSLTTIAIMIKESMEKIRKPKFRD